jgi:hypothetical protein
MSDPSPEYMAAVEAHEEAMRRYRQARDDFQAGRIACDVFLDAQAALLEANAIYTAAMTKEINRDGSSTI